MWRGHKLTTSQSFQAFTITSQRNQKPSLVFHCHFCTKYAFNELNIRAHELQYHEMLTPKCSTGLAEKQYNDEFFKYKRLRERNDKARLNPKKYCYWRFKWTLRKWGKNKTWFF